MFFEPCASTVYAFLWFVFGYGISLHDTKRLECLKLTLNFYGQILFLHHAICISTNEIAQLFLLQHLRVKMGLHGGVGIAVGFPHPYQ